MVSGITEFDDFMLNLTVADINLEMEPFALHFDGISDTSDVISRFITFSGNVIADRLSSMTRFAPALVKFNNLINAIIGIIPDEIDIPGTDLYLEGGINSALSIKKDEYMILPFDLSI